jgi:hypothetical protein
MQRVLEPEWLDCLPQYDARAQRSRRDLRRVNFLMGNARHVARALAPVFRSENQTMHLVDLGAGDGSFMQRVVRRLNPPDIRVTLVDRALVPGPMSWNALGVAADVHEFLARPGPRFDALVANLFLHHFEAGPLRRLLALAARRAPLFVACEPRRSRFAWHASRLLGALGCNDVTRHDAAVSVRAGFRGRELSALWPEGGGWRLTEGPAPPFGHLFVARRDAPL